MNRRFMFAAVVLSSIPLAALAQDSGGGGVGGMTVGVGAGYSFSSGATPNTFSILTPNTVSVRLRMGALTFEPMLSLAGAGGNDLRTTRVVIDTTDTTTTITNTATGGFTAAIAGNVLYALASAGPMSLHAVGGIGFGYVSATGENKNVTAPVTADTTETTTMAANLNWGLAVEWAFTKNLVVSAEAVNPLVTWNSTKTFRHIARTTAPQIDDSTVQSSGFSGGLTFAPDVRLLFVLFF